MFIEKIKIENILSHNHSMVEFGEGLNVIIGSNGAGKSTIIDSIVYALLAHGRGSEEVTRTTKANMLREGSSRGSIELTFIVGGNRYVIRREISQRGESSDLLKRLSPQEMVLAIGGSVPREVMKILNITEPRILTSTIIARQDFLNEVLLESSSKRKERILKLLGLEKLEKARENLGKAQKKLDSRIEEIERELGIKQQLEKDIKKIEEELIISRDERDKLRTKVEDSKRKVEKLETLKNEVDELLMIIPMVALYERKSREYKEKEERVKRLEEKRAVYEKIDLKEVLDLRNRIPITEDRLKTLREDLKKCVREIEKNESLIQSLSNKISEEYGAREVENFLKEKAYTKILEIADKMLSEIENNIATAKAHIEIYRNFQKSFREADRCPICGNSLTGEKIEHLIREHSAEIEKLSKKINELTASREGLREIASVLREAIKGVDSESRKISELKKKEEALDKELREDLLKCSNILDQAGFKDVPTDVPSRVQALDRILQEYNNLKHEIENLNKDLESIKDELKDLRNRLVKNTEEVRHAVLSFIRSRELRELENSDLSTIESFLRKYKNEISKDLESAKKSYEEDISKLNELNGKISRSEKDLEEKREEINRLKGLESEREILRKVRESLEKLAEFFKKDGVIAKTLTSRIRASLESEVNRILKGVIREFKIEIDEEFDFTVVYPSGVTRPIENLSGGEKTVLSLALRLALAKVLTGRIPRLMILDEPTQNLDSEVRLMIFDIIKRIAGTMDQIIVVTHDEDIVDKADRVIRVTNSGGVSEVSIEARNSSFKP